MKKLYLAALRMASSASLAMALAVCCSTCRTILYQPEMPKIVEED